MPCLRWIVAAQVCALAAASPVTAAPAPPPAPVEHEPPAPAYRTFPLEFVVKFNVPTGVVEPHVHLRPVGTKSFEKLPLVAGADGLYRVVLEGARVNADFEYFVLATDAKNPKNRPLWQSDRKPYKLVTTAPPPHATVTFDSKPSGAELTIDGKKAGPGPLTRVMFEGTHTVSVTLADYVDDAKTITVKGGVAQTVVFALKLKPARVVLDAQPDDAELLIDGFPVGRGHAEGELEPGKHRLAARRRGYEPQQLVVELKPAATHAEAFVLVKAAAPPVEEAPKPPPVAKPATTQPALNLAAFAPPPEAPKPPPPMHWAVPWTWGALGLAVATGAVGGYLVLPPNDAVALVDGVRAHSISYADAVAYNQRIAVAPFVLGASGVLLATGLGLVIVQNSASEGGGGSVVFSGNFQ